MSDPKVLFRPLKFGDAGGGVQHREPGVPEKKPRVVKKQRSTRRSCDHCKAFHRTCIMAVNEQNPEASCVKCTRLNKLCTYDPSQFQAEAKNYRKRNKKASAAEQGNSLKTEERNSGNEPESWSPSLASNSFEQSSNNSTTMLMESDNYLVDGLSASHQHYSDHSAFSPFQYAPYQQPVSDHALISYNAPLDFQRETSMAPRPMEHSQLASQPTSLITSLEPPSFSGTMSYSQVASQSPSSIPSLEPPSFSRTMGYSRLTFQSASFNGMPSLETQSFSRHVDRTNLQGHFGSQVNYMYEDRSTQTEDFIDLAARAFQRAQETYKYDGKSGGDKGHRGQDDETLHE